MRLRHRGLDIIGFRLFLFWIESNPADGRRRDTRPSPQVLLRTSLRQAMEPMAFTIPVMRLATAACSLGSPLMPRIELIAATPASRDPSSSSPAPVMAITLRTCFDTYNTPTTDKED